MINLRELDLSQIQNLMIKLDEQKFRGKQVFERIHKGETDIREMSNLPFSLRQKLIENYAILPLEIEQLQISKKDSTRKYLFQLNDGNFIESVYMTYKYGNSVCISSQVGCKMGCVFCASTLGGFVRDLTAGEMLSQILDIHNNIVSEKSTVNASHSIMKKNSNNSPTIQENTSGINHIVVMGIGEPFDNYDNLTKFIHLINSKEGLNIGMRNITVSTCGLAPKIIQFANDFPQVNLAISLHSSNDIKRSEIMPINNRYNILDLIETCKKYSAITNRRITYEYALIENKNDSKIEAEALSRLLKGMNAHVNLIPLNAVSETLLTSSSRDNSIRFKNVLEQNGIAATIRRKLGDDIDAACGQLRINAKSKKS